MVGRGACGRRRHAHAQPGTASQPAGCVCCCLLRAHQAPLVLAPTPAPWRKG